MGAGRSAGPGNGKGRPLDGKAQAYFHSEQNDGESWLIAEDGRGIRRWIGEYPELALGEPFGVAPYVRLAGIAALAPALSAR